MFDSEKLLALLREEVLRTTVMPLNDDAGLAAFAAGKIVGLGYAYKIATALTLVHHNSLQHDEDG